MTALVTGGARGIGAALVRAFARTGHDVVVADLERPEPGAPGRFVRCDVTDASDLAAAVAAVGGGRLDVLCLNAGVASGTSLGAGFDAGRYRRTRAVTVDGAVLGLQAALPVLGEGSLVLVTASLAGLHSSPDVFYAMAKHALVGLVRSAAAPLHEHGIRIEALCPGFVDTGLSDAATLTALGLALAHPDEVADAALTVAAAPGTGRTWAVQAGAPASIVQPPSIELAGAEATPLPPQVGELR